MPCKHVFLHFLDDDASSKISRFCRFEDALHSMSARFVFLTYALFFPDGIFMSGSSPSSRTAKSIFFHCFAVSRAKPMLRYHAKFHYTTHTVVTYRDQYIFPQSTTQSGKHSFMRSIQSCPVLSQMPFGIVLSLMHHGHSRL